jgi:hypothetical protein
MNYQDTNYPHVNADLVKFSENHPEAGLRIVWANMPDEQAQWMDCDPPGDVWEPVWGVHARDDEEQFYFIWVRPAQYDADGEIRFCVTK